MVSVLDQDMEKSDGHQSARRTAAMASLKVGSPLAYQAAKAGLLRHSAETAFCVSNTPVTAPRAAEAIRAHWTIENTSHYSRDVTLGEDQGCSTLASSGK